ncbi:Alpha/Beta hydrolase protein [Coemansia spiralis]|nr:Alpha/Beta hydrolase protein [Coemansia spiralis]
MRLSNRSSQALSKSLAAAGLLLAVAFSPAPVAASPAQHVFLPQHSSFLHGSLLQQPPFPPSRTASADLVSDSKWSRIETMDALPDYQLRIKQPSLCDKNTTQYSGYLDTAEDRHFFFWFFEARNPPKNADAPIVLWMNGGPGCSSFTGLLMELGPCRVDKGGKTASPNKYGWNDQAHVVFLDQPLNVGYSYGKDVFNSIDAGKDVYNFLQLFYHSFPQYASSELHVFGESYGGHYVPATAKAIHEANVEFSNKKVLGQLSLSEKQKRVLPLTSIGIGNGLTDPLVQYKYYSKMACNSTYPPVLKQEECDQMDKTYTTCARLIDACYKWKNTLACYPAEMYCNSMLATFQRSGANPYDVRIPCEGGNLCYPIMSDIDAFLNDPEVQKELGSDVSKFESCSQKVYTGFTLSGDWMKPYVYEIPPLLEAGIRVLIYAGDADFICNWYGNKAWAEELEWSGKASFANETDSKWVVGDKAAGEARTHKNFSFVRVFGAGHMVPYDQPETALDLINRWINNKSFY